MDDTSTPILVRDSLIEVSYFMKHVPQAVILDNVEFEGEEINHRCQMRWGVFYACEVGYNSSHVDEW